MAEEGLITPSYIFMSGIVSSLKQLRNAKEDLKVLKINL